MVMEHFVYLYQTLHGRVVYVGYGQRSPRSMAHSDHGHAAFQAWLRAHPHEIRIAGPYRDATVARSVEAALISAIDPQFNRAPGTGPRFMPLGVPPTLSRRTALPPLTVPEIGIRAGGALLVYLAPGDLLPDGRRKFDPAHPVDDDAVRNTERWWQIGSLQTLWAQNPPDTPRLLIGVHGRSGHRFVAASLRIDRRRLGDPSLRSPDRPGRWQVPLRSRSVLDAERLRGRRVEGASFGRMSHQLHIWVDGEGVVRTAGGARPRHRTARHRR